MSRAQNLLESLRQNVARINSTLDKIDSIQVKKECTDEDLEMLQILHRNEFSLYMDNSSIYDDLMEEIENENDFTRKRFADEANKLLKVEIISL